MGTALAPRVGLEGVPAHLGMLSAYVCRAGHVLSWLRQAGTFPVVAATLGQHKLSTPKMGLELPQVGQPRPCPQVLWIWGPLPPPLFGSSRPRPKGVNWGWDVRASAELLRSCLWLVPRPSGRQLSWRAEAGGAPLGMPPGGVGLSSTAGGLATLLLRLSSKVLLHPVDRGGQGEGRGGRWGRWWLEAVGHYPAPSPRTLTCLGATGGTLPVACWVMKQENAGAERALAADPSPPLPLIPAGWCRGWGVWGRSAAGASLV